MANETPTPESTPSTSTPKSTEPSAADKLTASIAEAWGSKRKRKYVVLGIFVLIVAVLATINTCTGSAVTSPTPSGMFSH